MRRRHRVAREKGPWPGKAGGRGPAACSRSGSRGAQARGRAGEALGPAWQQSDGRRKAGATPCRAKEKPDLGLHVGVLGTPGLYHLGAQTRNCPVPCEDHQGQEAMPCDRSYKPSIAAKNKVSTPLWKAGEARAKTALIEHLLGASHGTSWNPPNEPMRQVTCLPPRKGKPGGERILAKVTQLVNSQPLHLIKGVSGLTKSFLKKVFGF